MLDFLMEYSGKAAESRRQRKTYSLGKAKVHNDLARAGGPL